MNADRADIAAQNEIFLLAKLQNPFFLRKSASRYSFSFFFFLFFLIFLLFFLRALRVLRGSIFSLAPHGACNCRQMLWAGAAAAAHNLRPGLHPLRGPNCLLLRRQAVGGAAFGIQLGPEPVAFRIPPGTSTRNTRRSLRKPSCHECKRFNPSSSSGTSASTPTEAITATWD